MRDLKIRIASNILLLCLAGCSGVTSGRLHYLPEGSSYLNEDWELMCGIRMYIYGFSKGITENNRKDVMLDVSNRKKQTILDDSFKLTAVTLDAEFELDEDGRVMTISIYEIGNPLAEDDYNKILLSSGPYLRQKRIYEYNSNQDFFNLKAVEEIGIEQGASLNADKPHL